MLNIFRYIVLAFVISELLLYFIKYSKLIKWSNNHIVKSIFNLGIPLYRDKLISENNKDKIYRFLNDNINAYKIIDNVIYIRRKYLKWIPWLTPVLLFAKIELRETDLNKLTFSIRYSSIVSPILANLIYLIYFLLVRPTEESNIAVMSIILILIIYYLIGLIERLALKRKIQKIIMLDNSYNYFA